MSTNTRSLPVVSHQVSPHTILSSKRCFSDFVDADIVTTSIVSTDGDTIMRDLSTTNAEAPNKAVNSNSVRAPRRFKSINKLRIHNNSVQSTQSQIAKLANSSLANTRVLPYVSQEVCVLPNLQLIPCVMSPSNLLFADSHVHCTSETVTEVSKVSEMQRNCCPITEGGGQNLSSGSVIPSSSTDVLDTICDPAVDLHTSIHLLSHNLLKRQRISDYTVEINDFSDNGPTSPSQVVAATTQLPLTK